MSHVAYLLAVAVSFIAVPLVSAVNGPPADQVAQAQADTDVRVETAVPPDRTTVVEPAPGEKVVVEPATPSNGAAVRTDRAAVHHAAEVRNLPSSVMTAVERSMPGATIIDVDRVSGENAYDLELVSRDGRLYDARIDNNGRIVTMKLDRRESDRLAKLPEAVKSAIQQRYPGAVMYNTEVTVEDGKRAHEVEILHQGRPIDVKLTRDGRILETETDADDVGHDPDTRSSD